FGKFDRKSDEGFFVGYSMNSKAFRVYNIRTRKVEENLHIRFLEDKLIIAGDGPKWLFDIDILTKSMNYVSFVVGTNSNDLVGTEESIGAGHSSKETGSSRDYILMPLWKDNHFTSYVVTWIIQEKKKRIGRSLDKSLVRESRERNKEWEVYLQDKSLQMNQPPLLPWRGVFILKPKDLHTFGISTGRAQDYLGFCPIHVTD
ncbi:putative ribonuclease H-like domain-containing protein, partial [Tanacetum coccineum]